MDRIVEKLCRGDNLAIKYRRMFNYHIYCIQQDWIGKVFVTIFIKQGNVRNA